MHITIIKIKNHKKLTKSLFQIIFFLNIIIWVKYFIKYILSLILNDFIPLSSGFYYYVVTKEKNSNKRYITAFCIYK